ncbi:MAG TPA: DUF5723 family protein [Chitinophagaceae bacterium]|nr:DUF5723 family protein [Chitinophagaceae bacterium]
MKLKSFILLAYCTSILCSRISAQEFGGYRTGNYTGANGVFFNPANIADSRYRWDLNLFSFSSWVGNNKLSLGLQDLSDNLNGDSIRNLVFNDEKGPASGMASINVLGPTLMFNLNSRSALALSSRSRIMINSIDIDGKFANQFIDDQGNDGSLPYTLMSNEDMRLNVNAWTEFGLTYARVIKDQGRHFLKAGLTLKYLVGALNAFAHLDQFHSTIDYDDAANDTYLTNSSGRVGLGFGGVPLDNFEASDLLSFKSHGLGADLGLIYEFRKDTLSNRLSEDGEWRRDENKYKWRIGLALHDIGSIAYQRDTKRSGDYTVNIPANEKFYLNAITNASIDDVNDSLKNYPQYFAMNPALSGSSYRVATPATLQVDIDYHIHQGFYVNLGGSMALTKANSKAWNSRYYSYISVTPRYEGRAFGVYLPLSCNALTQTNMGLSLRIGNLILGSGSIISVATGQAKQLDLFVAAHFGGLQKNEEKRYQKKLKRKARAEEKEEEKLQKKQSD